MCLAVIFTLGLLSIAMGITGVSRGQISLTATQDLYGRSARLAGTLCIVLGLMVCGGCGYLWWTLPAEAAAAPLASTSSPSQR